jgi:hypothetical protein
MTGMMFDRCQNGAQKAGLIRLEALYTHGGVYVDSDVEPHRPFDPLLSLPAFAAWEDEKVVPDAVMGACKEHPAWMELIGRAREAIMNDQDAWHSGPGGTTDILPGRSDVLLLPPGAFYPAHYLEKSKLGQNWSKPWVFCEHKWHHSWGSETQKAGIAKNQRTPAAAPAPVVETLVIPPDLKIAICIPWNDIDDKRRRDSFDWCLKWWENAGIPVYVASGESRSAMRNEAARRAIADGATVLFFADADTWVPVHQVMAASVHASTTGHLTHAFEYYCRLGSAETRRGQMTHNPDARALSRAATRQRNHMSGASAVPVSLWDEIGGYDERFTSWGFEDRAFDMAAGCLGGSVDRIGGYAIHWFHIPAPEKKSRPKIGTPAVDLVIRYCLAAAKVPEAGTLTHLVMSRMPKGAQPDISAMRAILGEHGGPLAAEMADSAT